MFRPGSRPPVEWMRPGQTWPAGRLQPDAPVEAVRAQTFAQSLARILDQRGLSGRQASGLCGVDQRTVSRILTGTSYPDIATLARLEAGLGVALWTL